MTAKIYKFPKTYDGRLVCILRFMTGEKMDGRDFDREARKMKRDYYAGQAKAEAAREAAEAAEQAALEAAKIVPFRRYGGQR